MFPATGMTFGLDVIFAVLEERKFEGFSARLPHVPFVLIVPLKTLDDCLRMADELRRRGLNCDIAFEKSIGKAFEFADRNGIPYVMVVGRRELETGKVTVHDMDTGKEHVLSIGEAADMLMEATRQS